MIRLNGCLAGAAAAGAATTVGLAGAGMGAVAAMVGWVDADRRGTGLLDAAAMGSATVAGWLAMGSAAAVG